MRQLYAISSGVTDRGAGLWTAS